MTEMIKVVVMPDGTLEVIAEGFIETEGANKLEELKNRLTQKGLRPVVKNQKTEFTGEFHKHTHTHGVHDHY